MFPARCLRWVLPCTRVSRRKWSVGTFSYGTDQDSKILNVDRRGLIPPLTVRSLTINEWTVKPLDGGRFAPNLVFDQELLWCTVELDTHGAS